VTPDLGFSGLIRRTAPFSRLLRHTRGCIYSNPDPHGGDIPERIRGIIKNHLGRIYLRFKVDDYTTFWQRLEKDIVTGCSLSKVLFVMATN
jgi:hypothetical protein